MVEGTGRHAALRLHLHVHHLRHEAFFRRQFRDEHVVAGSEIGWSCTSLAVHMVFVRGPRTHRVENFCGQEIPLVGVHRIVVRQQESVNVLAAGLPQRHFFLVQFLQHTEAVAQLQEQVCTR